MKNLTKLKKYFLPLLVMIMTVFVIQSNVSMSNSAFPLYNKDNFLPYIGLILGLMLVLLNGSLIHNYKYSVAAAIVSVALGIYLKINYYQLPTFKKEESLELFKTSLFTYIDFLKSYYWAVLLVAILLAVLGSLISNYSLKKDMINNDGNRSYLSKTKTSIYMCIFTSLIAILAIKMNLSFGENNSPYNGLIIALLLVFVNGFLLNDYKISALSSLAISLIGIYLKVTYYILPYFEDAKLNESYIQNNFMPYILRLKQYFWAFALIFICVSILGSYLAKIIEKASLKAKELKKNKKVFLDTKMMAYISVFVAISVVVNVLRVGSISFGGFPIIFSGFVLGPLGGFIVGGLADVVSFIIRPSGQFNILFTLTSALTGAIPIIVVRFLGDTENKFSLWKVILGIGIGQLITSVLLAPLFVALFMGTDKGFAYFAIKALIKQSVSVPIYSIVLISLHESLMRSGINLEDIN